jgi:hypothetical protein
MFAALRKFVAIVFVSALASTVAFGQTLYSATGGSVSSNLNVINQSTGALVTAVGPIGFAVTGMAVHPGTGVLYGVTSANSPSNPSSLITINKSTGAGTLVGGFGGIGGPIADITFTPDGTLYGWCECSDDLVTINTATGVATVVGSSGISTFGSGLASDSSGTLFYAGDGANDSLRTVSRTTGLTTIVTTMTGSPQGDAVPALAFHPGGTLYGLDGLDGNPNVTLITINTTTGAVTTVGATLNGTDAIAFDPPFAGTAIPAVSDVGLLLLALALGTMGALAYSRRKAV